MEGEREGETKKNGKRKLEHEKIRLEMQKRKRKDKKCIEIEKEKLQFELKMKELELQGKSKAKSLPLDTSKSFDVTKHIRLVPPFQEKEVDKYFYILRRWQKTWNGKGALDLTFAERCNGKAREIYTQLSLEQSSDYNKVKELILKAYELVLRLTGRNLEIAEKNMTRHTLNLLEQKNNYLIGGVLQRSRLWSCKTKTAHACWVIQTVHKFWRQVLEVETGFSSPIGWWLFFNS